jgi:hypothetical protein
LILGQFAVFLVLTNFYFYALKMNKTLFPLTDVLRANGAFDPAVEHQPQGETLGTVYACRIPKDYFETSGKGESDIAVHAGSYHLALKEAGI